MQRSDVVSSHDGDDRSENLVLFDGAEITAVLGVAAGIRQNEIFVLFQRQRIFYKALIAGRRRIDLVFDHGIAVDDKTFAVGDLYGVAA